ncbi:hypothetical protein SCLCIDRAFT_1216889 [Scleroderma citrinum Foug A]|uniref:DUF6593 domain-containing protein n=1 Tax=Scleroderma citrinum Foug A TaxID=1036808 RepID=A0A0C3A6M3_9AGAM|nr:hypothetical protein SCLCIDRAFT_1216889 [Scleroderma citrinum Foug A]
MRLTLSSESVRNTVMINENGQVLYKTSTPFRLGVRTTTIYKVVPNTNPNDIQDRRDAIGKIEWHLFGTSIMRLHGQTSSYPDMGSWGGECYSSSMCMMSVLCSCIYCACRT